MVGFTVTSEPHRGELLLIKGIDAFYIVNSALNCAIGIKEFVETLPSKIVDAQRLRLQGDDKKENNPHNTSIAYVCYYNFPETH